MDFAMNFANNYDHQRCLRSIIVVPFPACYTDDQLPRNWGGEFTDAAWDDPGFATTDAPGCCQQHHNTRKSIGE
jgi:hypothetical protein